MSTAQSGHFAENPGNKIILGDVVQVLRPALLEDVPIPFARIALFARTDTAIR